ncbi:hypothetical protein LCGC14_0468990 [marine sediment metagenome]|uniref:Uncharacterized protein n=1 Tax=marine sediment metagenome TaxID=412755 RepID=A0A0F9VLN9_9ZZZZ
MTDHQWSNRATQDFAEWLVEDVLGAEMARRLLDAPTPQDTPVTNLAVKLRGIMIKSLPIPMDPRWMAEVNWVEVAAYLVSNVDLDED